MAGSAPIFASDLAGVQDAANARQAQPGFVPPGAQNGAPPAPAPGTNLPALMPQIATPPEPPVPVTHDVTIVTTKKMAQARCMGVPPEEFGIDRNSRSIPECNYCFHEIVTKTEAQLINEGFDATQIKGLQPYTGNTDIETLARDTVQEHFYVGDNVNPSARLIRLTEHYVRMDYEGDGKPQLYQVITGGEVGDVLRKDGKDCVTPFDAIPFAATTPVPITHRFFGRSIADLTMQLQREKTALKRGSLDNLYLAVNPRVEVAEANAGPNTLDDLLVSRPGGVIRTKTAGGVNWQVVPNIIAGVLPMVQYLDAELESRTGVSKQTQGIDANALQNQSATAVAQVFSASQMRMKLIARLMAEGVRDMFSLMHATIRKHGQQKATIRLRNNWIDIDPREWKTRDHMTINVGLGTGGKAQQFAQTMAIANVQKEMIAGGKTNLVGDKQLYNTAAELTKIMGHKNPDKFFNDPDAKGPNGQLLNPPPQAPPDPKVAAIQAQSQADQAQAAQKAQLDQQSAQQDAQHQQIAAQVAAQVAQLKAGLDAKLKILDAHIKAVGAVREAHHDNQRQVLDLAQSHQAHRQGMEQRHQSHRMDIASDGLDMVSRAHAHDNAQSAAAQQAGNEE